MATCNIKHFASVLSYFFLRNNNKNAVDGRTY